MLDKILENQKKLFRSGYTRPLDERIRNLEKLKDIILKNDNSIVEAIKKDIGRPDTETYTSEIFISLKEIDFAINNLKKWAKPIKAKTPLILMPGKSYIQYEPYGSALILGSWNYPLQLLISPLVGAIAAGNCAVIKPSEISHSTSALITEMINNEFDKNYIYCINGGVRTSEKLLKLDFDYIFFTGSTSIGEKSHEGCFR